MSSEKRVRIVGVFCLVAMLVLGGAPERAVANPRVSVDVQVLRGPVSTVALVPTGCDYELKPTQAADTVRVSRRGKVIATQKTGADGRATFNLGRGRYTFEVGATSVTVRVRGPGQVVVPVWSQGLP